MTQIEIFTIIGAIGSIVISIVTVSLQWRKWTAGEGPAMAATAAGSLTDTSLRLVNELRKERDSDREIIDRMQNEIKLLRNSLDELEDLRDWAERLVHQLKANGIEPVKITNRNRNVAK